VFPPLNFPPIDARYAGDAANPQIFDVVRKKFVELTPEEWVRQHLVHFLVQARNYPLSLLGVEKQLKLNNTIKRTDLVVYHSSLKPLLLAECKAPQVDITQLTVDQALRYNIPLQVPFVLLTNGLKHVSVKIEHGVATYLRDVPDYQELNQ